MDPTECLRRLLDLTYDIGLDEDLATDREIEIMDKFTALHEWIRGGFPPEQWAKLR